jgi:hypothetical protein
MYCKNKWKCFQDKYYIEGFVAGDFNREFYMLILDLPGIEHAALPIELQRPVVELSCERASCWMYSINEI